jgi:hypothetical protein
MEEEDGWKYAKWLGNGSFGCTELWTHRVRQLYNIFKQNEFYIH